MRVIFHGFPHTGTYASATQSAWVPGEVREVEEDEAATLVADFDGAFAEEPTSSFPTDGPPRSVLAPRGRTRR